MIDIAETLQAQAEALTQHHDELRALSVNVMNLVELVKVQHEALTSAIQEVSRAEAIYRAMNGVEKTRQTWVDLGLVALAKYDEIMGDSHD